VQSLREHRFAVNLGLSAVLGATGQHRSSFTVDEPARSFTRHAEQRCRTAPRRAIEPSSRFLLNTPSRRVGGVEWIKTAFGTP
jgi:hypothetical protein